LAQVRFALIFIGVKISKQRKAGALATEHPESALAAAWRFLDQCEIDDEFTNAREFWRWAIPRWNATRIPPVPMLPAPPAGGE
jgi:hypothetical protein